MIRYLRRRRRYSFKPAASAAATLYRAYHVKAPVRMGKPFVTMGMPRADSSRHMWCAALLGMVFHHKLCQVHVLDLTR